jgi:hypothetical protein
MEALLSLVSYAISSHAVGLRPAHFGSWTRIARPGLAPSEQAVATALRNTLPELLATAAKTSILVKFIRDRLDLSTTERISLAA